MLNGKKEKEEKDMRKRGKDFLISSVAIIVICIVFIKLLVPIISEGLAGIMGESGEIAASALVSMAQEDDTDRVSEEKSKEKEPVPANVAIYDDNDVDEVYVEYIDVGQGDSTLIYNKTHEFSCLIDTGLYEAYDNVQATLKDYGIGELDVLVLTHPDTDHIQSAVDVIKDYNIPVVYMSKAVNNEAKAYEYLMEYLGQYSGDVIYPGLLDGIELGSENAVLLFLGPIEYSDLSDTNGSSLIVKLVNGSDSFLFLGDATGDEMDALIGAGIRIDADVLKASHHGSANDGCNSESLFKAVDPEVFVVSCGYQNEYGHPHIETMQLVQDYNIKLYRTDLQGNISCKSTGNGIIWGQDPTTVFTNGNGFN